MMPLSIFSTSKHDSTLSSKGELGSHVNEGKSAYHHEGLLDIPVSRLYWGFRYCTSSLA